MRIQQFRLPEAAAAAETLLPADAEASLEAPDPAGSALPADALAQYNQMLSAMQELVSLNGQQLSAIEKTAASARTRFADTERRQEQSASAYSTQAALAVRAQAQFDHCEQERDRELAGWLAQFGTELQPHMAEETLQELDRREAAADELRSRLERSVTYIEETARTQQEKRPAGSGGTDGSRRADSDTHRAAAAVGREAQQLESSRRATGCRADSRRGAGARELRARNARLRRVTRRPSKRFSKRPNCGRGGGNRTRRADRQRETSGEWASAVERSPFERADEVAALAAAARAAGAIADIIARHREQSSSCGPNPAASRAGRRIAR